jgi:glycosyltransferase involved in cell wall biosynthesis
MPLISVIVTVYNLENYISDCLESLVNQKFSDFEVIVVDNGSLDNSVVICRKYAEQFPKIISLIELGQPSFMHRGHQAGIAAAQGRYLHIIDGDDLVRNGYLQEVAEIIEKQPVDIIIGRFESLTERTAIPHRDAVLEPKKIDNCESNDVIQYIGTTPAYHLAFWRYIFNRKLIEGNGLFQSFIPQNATFPLLDALVTFRLLFAASTYALIEKPIYYYRQRDDSLSAPSNKQTLWHMQSFTEFAMFLYVEKFTGSRRDFVLAKLSQSIKLAIGQSDLWGKAELGVIATLLKESRAAIRELLKDRDVQERLNHFSDWVNNWDGFNLDELESYFSAIRREIVNKVSFHLPDTIYVFPGGQFARQTQRWLIQSGFRKVYFLDNNPYMEGRVIQGSRCYSLDRLRAISFEQQASFLIVISTIYEELDQLLYGQCRAAGIPQENILIC